MLLAGGGSGAEVLGALYRRHYRMIAAYLYRRTGNVHVAEDLAAETFFAALRSVGRVRASTVPARFWLLRIATNAANRWARDAGRRARRERESRPAGSAGAPGRGEDHEVVREAVLRLPERFGSVIALHYFAALSVQEVAVVLGCREGTVKSRLWRGREMVRRGIEQIGGAG